MQLDGRTALVVEGARGIGLAVTRALDDAGARLLVTDTEAGQAENLARALGQNGLQCDPSDGKAVGRMAYAAADLLEDIDILVLSLNGGSRPGDQASGHLDDSSFDTALAGWSRPLHRLVRQFAPAMRARGEGAVLVVASQPLWPDGGRDPWAAAQEGWLVAAVRALAADWSADGLRINALIAARDDTPPLPRFLAARTAAVPPQVPLRRLAQPAEIAPLVLSLLAHGAAATGQVLRLDGGRDVAQGG